MSKPARESSDVPTPEDYAMTDSGEEPPHASSLTAVAEEALESGIAPPRGTRDEVPGDDALLRAGDPDVDPLDNELSGEDVPGGSTPTPDQNQVDDIGKSYGAAEMDGGELTSTEEVLGRRDRHRAELEPPRAPHARGVAAR